MLTIIAVTVNFAAVFFAVIGGYGVACNEKDKSPYICFLTAVVLSVVAMIMMRYS